MNHSEQLTSQNTVLFGGSAIASLSAGFADVLPDHNVTRVVSVSDSGSKTGEIARQMP